MPNAPGRADHALPSNSDINLLGYGKRAVNLNPKIPDGALNLAMAE